MLDASLTIARLRVDNSSALNISAPHASSVGNVSADVLHFCVIGDSFGMFLAATDDGTRCNTSNFILNATSTFTCTTNVLSNEISSVEATIVSVQLRSVSRLDDIEICLRSPQGKLFYLMKSACFGHLQSSSVLYAFVIEPNSILGMLPISSCPDTGVFQALEASKILSELKSAAVGSWSVVIQPSQSSCSVGAGTQGFLVESVSIRFKLSFLKFYIANTQSRQVEWTSDSSVFLAASSDGFGQNAVGPCFRIHSHSYTSNWSRRF
jgi:hypothetical protein